MAGVYDRSLYSSRLLVQADSFFFLRLAGQGQSKSLTDTTMPANTASKADASAMLRMALRFGPISSSILGGMRIIGHHPMLFG